MPIASVEEDKLETLVDKAVQKHLSLKFVDMDEIRRSPGGAIIRVEGRLDTIDARLDRDMVTRTEFREEIGEVCARLDAVEVRLDRDMVTRTEFKEESGEVSGRLDAIEIRLDRDMVTRTEFREESGKVHNQFGKIVGQFGKIDGQFGKVDGQFGKVDGQFGKVIARLDAIESRLDREMVSKTEFKQELNKLGNEFKDRFWKLNIALLLLAALILFTNPIVLDLFKKLLGIVK